MTNTPGQVYDVDGRRFLVYLDVVTRTAKFLEAGTGATFTSLSFHSLYPNAELILDA